MKTYLLILCLICIASLGLSQNQASDFTGNKSEQTRNPRNDLMNFVPNEVLVKLKDDVPVKAGARMKAAGVSSVDKVLQIYGVTSLEKLFPSEQKPQKTRMMKSPQGKTMAIPALDKIYRVSLSPAQTVNALPTNIFQLINELKALPEVEYAEPNYIYSIANMQPIGPELTADDVAKLKIYNTNKSKADFTPNDPLYGQQWYIPAVKADQVWQQTTGDTTQIIAILDTGVDWTHPDLKNKIWTNPNPATEWNMEGILNDIRGWDFINNDNNPMDDNSHGTHVAGIAAAETNNGIGIAGVCPKAKIMPIKVLNNKGLGDIATITKGINYATSHGATVLNLSLGSYVLSLVMQDALQNAYPKTIIVAAAGNDEHNIYDILPTGPAVMYPAGLPFVFGVQVNAQYSNYDPDGPVYSEYEDGFNYEIKAPGSAISTVPNGSYRIFNGTSMATPVISGAVAMYRSLYPGKSLEELWSDFIHSSKGIIDLDTVFFSTSKTPQLDLVSYTIDDQNEGNDKDNKADAGETINLTLKIRNTGSPANVVYAKIQTTNDGNPDDITIVKDSVNFGSVGIYRTLINDKEPFKIKINKECYNNSNISLKISLHNTSDSSVVSQNIKLKIYNGQELSGILLKDMILTSDKKWIITNSLRIGSGVKLKIEPGTEVGVFSTIDNRGEIEAIGTENRRISMIGNFGGKEKYKFADLRSIVSIDVDSIEDCTLTYVTDMKAKYIKNCIIDQFNHLKAENVSYSSISNYIYKSDLISYWYDLKNVSKSHISNVYLIWYDYYSQRKYDQNTIDNFIIADAIPFVSSRDIINNNVFSNFKSWFSFDPFKYPVFLIDQSNSNINNQNNSFLSKNEGCFFAIASGNNDLVNSSYQYWGTNQTVKIKDKYYDFNNNSRIPYLNTEPKLVAPSDSCPGHVWKILVNGKDAQDEAVDPLGVGKHQFDVYFNRAMNKDSIPQVTFGGIYPYTSNKINENGTWSEDGKIYTVYKSIKLTSGDGINQIRVAGARQDTDWGWPIPVEDSRFSFIISAANSASTEFMATQGLGKVQLEWNNSDLEDGLGYNMYRMEHINDSTLTEAIMINSTLISDTMYTDFAVTPNKKYYYYYKVMRTNLSETDKSKVVSATPFTAAKGDANGDLSVNVLDITSIVAYLLNNNPQPFIFEAADMNSDNNINVLDIVGVVNKILVVPQKAPSIAMTKQVELFMQNDTLFANSNVPVGGIQLDLKGISSMEVIHILKALDGFESGNSLWSDSLRLIFYSMSGKNIPAAERIPLLKLKTGSTITNAIFGETNGSPIKINYILTRIGDIQNNMNQTLAELGQNFPNPVNGKTIIPIRIYEQVDEAVLRVINMSGQLVEVIRLSNPYIGEHLLSWNSGANKGLFVYTLEIKNGNQKQICPVKKMIVQ